MKKLESLGYQLVKGFSNYKTIDGFEKYLNVLKILVLHKNPKLVELY